MSDTKHEELDSPTAWERLGVTTIPMCAVKDALDIAWAMSKRVCICLVGETGVGKTPIVKEWADEHDGYAHTLHFGHLNIEQVSMAMFNEDATQFGHVPPDWLVTLNQKAAEGKRAVTHDDYDVWPSIRSATAANARPCGTPCASWFATSTATVVCASSRRLARRT